MELPTDYIIFDTEYTAWESSQARGWSDPGEYREIIQLGAIKVTAGREIDHLLCYGAPVKNPLLSAYIINLTGVTQAAVDTQGLPIGELITHFATWAANLPLYSYGHDGEVLAENCALLDVPNPIPATQFHDIRPYFAIAGVDPADYMSSTIPTAFGATPPPAAHDALNDARSILVAINARARFADAA